MQYAGHCHCGNIRLTLESAKAPELLGLRLCDCSFCRAQGARYISDPAGRIEITIADPAARGRYQMGHGIGEFLFCRNCGVYIGATMEHDGACLSVLNVNVLGDADAFSGDARTASYDGESFEDRLSRRLANWTPTTLNSEV